MSFSLTANFLANARGITFEDTASVTWAFNANTNEIEATATGVGEVSTISFGTTGLTPSSPTGGAIVVAGTLAIGSGGTGQTTAAAAFAALSPLTTEGDIIYETAAPAPGRLPIGAANTALVSNGSVPLWEAIVNSVAAGTGITVSAATGAVTIGCSITQSSGANPTGTVGLAAVDGSAATFLRSDGAPPLSQAIAPTWTGAHIFTPSTAVVAVTVNAAVNEPGLIVQGSSTTGESAGLYVYAGTNTSDYALIVANEADSANFLTVRGDGSVLVGAPTGGNQGAGTLNAAGLYVNGVSVAAPTGANPTGTVGLAAVDGSAATFLRSDGAPPLSQAIAPTWTGDHTFTPGSGVGITVNGNTTAAAGLQVNAGANQWGAWLVGSSTSGQSYGPVINAGTTSADYALFVQNYNASIASGTTYFAIRGDGAIAFHGASPQAQSTGYGTPTAASKTTNFAGTSATLAQCGGMLSTLILYFKALGLLGA